MGIIPYLDICIDYFGTYSALFNHKYSWEVNMATIYMVFGKEEYAYGTYPFKTAEEKNRVNELAMQIRVERGCQTYVKEVE